jgi:hypothetical protein
MRDAPASVTRTALDLDDDILQAVKELAAPLTAAEFLRQVPEAVDR